MRPLDLRFINGDEWKVISPYPYFGQFWKGVVPEGFITDFASVPRGLWNLFPPTGAYGPAAVIHDFLYQTGDASRADADATFLEAMTRLGIGRFTRYTLYWGVRTFGSAAYVEKDSRISR